jgi:hypothetical protein
LDSVFCIISGFANKSELEKKINEFGQKLTWQSMISVNLAESQFLFNNGEIANSGIGICSDDTKPDMKFNGNYIFD